MREHLGKSISTSLIVTAFIAACTPGEQLEATVKCNKIEGGYSCEVARTKGVRPFEVCWDLEQVCKNGVKAQLHTCTPAPLNQDIKTIKLISSSELQSNEKCTEVSAFAVNNVELDGFN